MSHPNALLNPTLATCQHCPWEQACSGGIEAAERLAQHMHLRHGEPMPVRELSGATWQERAASAVQQVANRGADFLIFEALREFGVGDPPNAKTAIGRFSALIHDLGYAHPVGYEKSRRDGTKRSAVAVWNRDVRRCTDMKCRQRNGVV